MINSTSVKIDEAKALEWARVNMPVAISEVLDLKMVEDWAKKNPEAADFAVITEGKKSQHCHGSVEVWSVGNERDD